MHPRRLPFVAIGLAIGVFGCEQERTRQAGGALAVVGETSTRAAHIDFGSVGFYSGVSREVRIRNVGRGAISLTSLERPDGGSVPDAFFFAFRPLILAPGEETLLAFSFRPIPTTPALERASYSAHLVLQAEEAIAGEDRAEIWLQGEGVKPSCLLPEHLDFGCVPLGSSAAASFAVKNPYRSTALATLELSEMAEGTFALASPAAGRWSIEPEDHLDVSVTFSPHEARRFTGAADVKPAEGCAPRQVALFGSGVDDPISWKPAVVDCGFVPPGLETSRQVVFANCSHAAVSLTEMRVSGDAFAIPDSAPALAVPPGGERSVAVWCRPQALGLHQGALRFRAAQGEYELPLRVVGGGPDIEAEPLSIDFGSIPFVPEAPLIARRVITVRNVGLLPDGAGCEASLKLGTRYLDDVFAEPFVLVEPEAPTGTDELRALLNESYDANAGLLPGEELEIVVELEPRSSGEKRARLVLLSNDLDEPALGVEVRAQAVEAHVCTYELSQVALGFGVLPLSEPQFRSFDVVNAGTVANRLCTFSGIRLAEGSSPEFALAPGTPEVIELAPGERQAITVVASTDRGAEALTHLSGAVEFEVWPPTAPNGRVGLVASLAPLCLVISPPSLNFGTVRIGCSSANHTMRLINGCEEPLTIDGFLFQPPGPASAEFSMTPAQPLPPGGLTVAPGDELSIQVSYSPSDTGTDESRLRVATRTSAGTPIDYRPRLSGRGDATGIQADSFSQGASGMVDLMIVTDGSVIGADANGNVSSQYDALRLLEALLDELILRNADFHLGVLRGKVDSSGTFGALESDGAIRYVDNSTADKHTSFMRMLRSASNGHLRMPLEAIRRSVSPPLAVTRNGGFLRADASLVVVIILLGYDQSAFNLRRPMADPLLYYQTYLAAKERPDLVVINLLAPLCTWDFFDRVPELVRLTNGFMHDYVCDDGNWLSMVFDVASTYFEPRRRYCLTSEPSAGSLDVRVSGRSIPPVDAQNVVAWTYDAQNNCILFSEDAAPVPGAQIELVYSPVCH